MHSFEGKFDDMIVCDYNDTEFHMELKAPDILVQWYSTSYFKHASTYLQNFFVLFNLTILLNWYLLIQLDGPCIDKFLKKNNF